MIEQNFPRRFGRSFFALFAGFVLVVVLSIATDIALHAAGVYPPQGQPMSARLLVLATIYRTLFAIAGSYTTARLAPHHPMQHALLGGVIGLLLSLAGAVTTCNHPETHGAHWYPIALVILAMPQAWLGGKIFAMQSRPEEAH